MPRLSGDPSFPFIEECGLPATYDDRDPAST